MCLAILVFLTTVNLRGLRQPGILFMLPTVVFVCFLFGVIAWGVYQSIVSGGHPRAVTPPPHIQAFAEPVMKSAQRSLAAIIAILMLLLKGERRVVIVDVPWYIGH